MTFFYNLNDKLNAIREKPETTHGQLNERDMGKHNNKTTGFDALAKKAGKEYGSKAAGERVAGAQFQKMKKAGQLEEAGNNLKSYSTSALKAASSKDANTDKKSGVSAQHSTQQIKDELKRRNKEVDEGMSRAAKGYEKYGKQGMQALAKAGREGKALDPVRAKYDKYDNDKPVDEGMGDVVKKVGGAVLNKLGHGSDKDMRKDLQRKMGMTPTGDKPDGALKYAAKTFIKHAKDPLGLKNEAGLPMTTVNGKKVPKFAADGRGANDLAKKKTFADKIAGAKQEVEEMLGDVAAEAIKGVLSPKQKKIDMNKNGKLDANDFAMLRKGGNKQVADEGFPTVDSARDEMRKRKVGDVTHGDKHDTQEIPGGRRVTRRVDPNTGYSVGADSDEPAPGEKRGRGRPKGADKGPERVTGRATKHKGGRKTNEGDLEITDRGEYDQEGDMAKDSIKTVVRHAQALEKILGDNDNLPEWVQSKLAKIESMMTAVDDYMQNQEDDEMAVGEEKTSTRDTRAERAGRKVAKDIEYDEKKKDGIHGKKRGSEDARAEKAGKKVTKDIEYDEKKDKPKKVKEQGGTDTPTASSGFSYGQGIYDSMNRELESMISEGMNINMSMNTDANGGPSRSVTVTATDDDAMKLGELLKNAGLGGDYAMGGQVEVHGAEDVADKIRQAIDGDHGHDDSEVCDACGQADCGCETVDEAYGDDVVDQNSPDYPTNTETNDDALQYSGGLNGPKSTGQTTIPVIASQDERQKGYGDGFDEDSLARLREMAGIRETKKDVEEEKTEEGNLFTKGLADDDVKVGEKIPGTDAVKKKDIDEGILASTASLWKQYKGQYGV